MEMVSYYKYNSLKPETKVKSFSVFLRAIYDFSAAFHCLHFLFIAMNHAEVKKLRFLTVHDIIRDITL